MIVVYIILDLLLLFILLYLFAVAPSFWSNKMVETLGVTLFAHRGLHDIKKGIPENSMAAFEAAVQHKTAIELDVRLSSDGVPIVFHDDTMKRMTSVEGYVRDMTAKQLSEITLANTTQQIPPLQQVLSFIDGSIPLLIELKTEGKNYKQLCTACMELLDQYKGCFVIESFDPRALWWLRKNRPNIGRGQLAAHDSVSNKSLAVLLRHLCLNFLSRPHFVAYEEKYIKKIPGVFIGRYLFGAAAYTWTVTDAANASTWKRENISSIFEGFIPR